jgi:hypothetical protein
MAWVIELLPYLLSVAKAGGDIVAAINWSNEKAQAWKDTGTEPTDADIAEIRSRRHANDEIINRG